jgi:hypothetical protein
LEIDASRRSAKKNATTKDLREIGRSNCWLNMTVPARNWYPQSLRVLDSNWPLSTSQSYVMQGQNCHQMIKRRSQKRLLDCKIRLYTK